MARSEISRREFVQGASLLGLMSPLFGIPLEVAASMEGSSAKPLPLRPRGSMQSSVVVVGGGLAGLAAAWELEAAGHEVTVLEARTRPGGRVHTVRDPYADGLYSEVGAVAFSEAYAVANRYIDELGLERSNYAFSQNPPVYHFKNRRFSPRGDGDTDWPFDLTEEERTLGPMGILAQYLIQTVPPEIANPEAWDQAPLVDLDEISLTEYLRRQGASEGAVELIANTQYFGGDPDETSALSVALADIGMFFSGGGLFVLAGGNDRLPTAMADSLQQEVQYGVEVTKIRMDGDRVEIEAQRAGAPVAFSADRVIATLPAPVLGKIPIEPELPARQKTALDRLPYRNIVRAQQQVQRGFWHDEGVAGAANTDLFDGRIDRQPYSDAGGPDRRAILEAFMEGKTADDLEARSDSEIMEYALDQLEKVHPDIRKNAEGGTVKHRGRDPYSQAAYSWPGPSDVSSSLRSLQMPHHRLHFAGEHTSVLRATMEGALRSGIRAAREVDAASGR